MQAQATDTQEETGTYGSPSAAKNGMPLPVFNDGQAMFSRYNPQRDAEVFAAAADGALFLIVPGVGSGIHIRALLNADPRRIILAVEKTQQIFDTLHEQFDLSDLHRNGRVYFCTPESLYNTICTTYMPALYGNLQFIPNRAWAEHHPQTITRLKKILADALNIVSADYSVQAHFGKIWHRNILLNTAFFERHDQDVLIRQHISRTLNCGTAYVIAAGPSLDSYMPLLQYCQKENACIIAADTAYHALILRGIIPDIAVSTDGQLISAQHFICRPLQPALLAADLCANHSAVQDAYKHGCPVLFFRNRHPLSALAGEYIARTLGAAIPEIGSGSGTVAIAAADLAVKLGYRNIKVIGADFAYCRGKPYARGTYLETRFGACSTRTAPAEEMYSALMYRTPTLSDGTGRVETDTLTAYKNSFYQFTELHAHVHIERCGYDGINSASANESPAPEFFCGQRKKTGGLSFSQWYIRRLEEAAGGTCSREAKTKIERSILPLIAFYRRKMQNTDYFDPLKLAYTQSSRYTR